MDGGYRAAPERDRAGPGVTRAATRAGLGQGRCDQANAVAWVREEHAQKRRAASGLFGSRPKKPKSGAAATRRDEVAAKAARFRKVVKQPQKVSA